MTQKTPYLAPPEWMFAVEDKELLPNKWKHCWIEDGCTFGAFIHEVMRENRSRISQALGKEIVEESNGSIFGKYNKPFVELWSTQRGELVSLHDEWTPGVYGNFGIIDANIHETFLDSDSTYSLHINWDLEDSILRDAFDEFLKLRKTDANIFKKKGRKTSYREFLQQLAAHRLVSKFKSSKAAYSFIRKELGKSFYGKEKLLYKNPESLDLAAKKGKKLLMPEGPPIQHGIFSWISQQIEKTHRSAKK